ncbi:M56 family metallopeptidase [Dokdonia sp.]|uniref:M56 family metallopeptidase n=1 Tax=Dokdonia sp. TaxID=2024995 RepID=UPI0032634AD3
MIVTYLIKSTLCLAVLFGFYKIALEGKALHHFKRFYLLVSLIFSLTIPLVTFTYTTAEVSQDIWVEGFAQAWDQHVITSPPSIVKEETNYLPYILWSIYGGGILFFGGRFILNLFRLKRKITQAETLEQPDFTLALLSQSIIPHSFLKYIFLSRKRYQNREIPSEVIAHEATHVRQKHSLDILFIEFLQVIFWFNPLFWITKKSITLNHEFLADQGAIKEQHDIYQYQHILLNYAGSTHHTSLESPFNYSSTKKRILMLSQSFSRKRLAISALLLIPIIVGCVLVFNQGIIAQPSSKSLAIEGHWIDHANENQDVYIYEEDETLWWDQKVVKAPIIIKDDSYFLASSNVPGSELWELSIAENGFLKLGESTYFTPPEDTVSYRIDGIWTTPDGKTKYHFITKNGGPTCDVIDVSKNKSTRYYPKLVDNGMTFTIDNDWHTFTFDKGRLTMHDGSELKRIENHSVYGVENITLEILENGSYSVNGTFATDENLSEVLHTFNTDLTKEERQNQIEVLITAPKQIHVDQIKKLRDKLTQYGIHQIQIPGGLIVPSTVSKNYLKVNHPTKQDLVRWLDASQYGVWLDGVQIKNDLLKEYHSDDLPYYIESKLEKNAANYGKHYVQVNIMTNPYWQEKRNVGLPSTFNVNLNTAENVILKPANQNQQTSNYATAFVKGAQRNGKEAFVIEIKNKSVRVNGKESSITTLRKDIDAITKDWEETDYTETYPSILIKNPNKEFLKELNKEFLKTHYSKANGGMDLIPPPPPAPPAPKSQLPPPPPPPSVEDHLTSMNEIGGVFYYEKKEISFDRAIQLVKSNEHLNVQTRHPYTNAPKTYISKEPITFSPKDQNKKPVTKGDIKVYNKLAKKYNKNINGQILKTEVSFMYDIYNRMTEKQKKNAEPYPAIPPPPPPAPKAPKASKKGGAPAPAPAPAPKSDHKLASTQEILGIQTIQEQTKAHLDKGGVFVLNDKTVSKKEILDFYSSATTETTRVRVDKKSKPAVMYVSNIPKEMAYTPMTQKDIQAYNKLAKKYNANPNGKIKKQEVRKLYHVYVNMTEAQRTTAEPYPALPSPPQKKGKRESLVGVKGEPLKSKREPLIGVKGV